MSFISSKTILPGTGISMGAPGSAYTALQSVPMVSGTPYVLPAGDWFIPGQTSLTVQYSANGGGTWANMNPAATGAFVRSDGANMQLSASASITAVFFGPA